jgi:hypothetical protein
VTEYLRESNRGGRGTRERSMEQKIEPLSEEDESQVEKQRTWVRDHYDPESRHHYDTLDGKLRLLETILRENWIKPNETWKLQSLAACRTWRIIWRTGYDGAIDSPAGWA